MVSDEPRGEVDEVDDDQRKASRGGLGDDEKEKRVRGRGVD